MLWDCPLPNDIIGIIPYVNKEKTRLFETKFQFLCHVFLFTTCKLPSNAPLGRANKTEENGILLVKIVTFVRSY